MLQWTVCSSRCKWGGSTRGHSWTMPLIHYPLVFFQYATRAILNFLTYSVSEYPMSLVWGLISAVVPLCKWKTAECDDDIIIINMFIVFILGLYAMYNKHCVTCITWDLVVFDFWRALSSPQLPTCLAFIKHERKPNIVRQANRLTERPVCRRRSNAKAYYLASAFATVSKRLRRTVRSVTSVTEHAWSFANTNAN